MKKFLIFLSVMLLLTSFAEAKSIKVLSLQNYSTENPSDTYKIQILENINDEDIFFQAGTVITGRVIKIQHAERLKRNAYFEFIPTSVAYDGESKSVINPDFTAKVIGYTPMSPTTLVFNVSKKTAGFFFKGVTQGISFVEGVATASEGERIKSGFVKMYKDSPLSYIEVGSELKVETGDVLLLKFKRYN